MGVDINLWFEQKIDGKWQPLEIPENLIPDGRDYEVFAFIAGVNRAEVIKKANFHGRGLPKVISERINGAIKAVRNLNIILTVEQKEGAYGQEKYIFTLNPAFE